MIAPLFVVEFAKKTGGTGEEYIKANAEMIKMLQQLIGKGLKPTIEGVETSKATMAFEPLSLVLNIPELKIMRDYMVQLVNNGLVKKIPDQKQESPTQQNTQENSNGVSGGAH